MNGTTRYRGQSDPRWSDSHRLGTEAPPRPAAHNDVALEPSADADADVNADYDFDVGSPAGSDDENAEVKHFSGKNVGGGGKLFAGDEERICSLLGTRNPALLASLRQALDMVDDVPGCGGEGGGGTDDEPGERSNWQNLKDLAS